MNVFLREIETNDAEKINGWRLEENYALTTSVKNFISLEREISSIKNYLNSKDNIFLGICLVGNLKLIGFIKVSNIDFRNRNAEFDGILISKEYQRKHYATEATNLLLDFIFGELNINRFYGFWLENHSISIKWASKMGFKKEGVLRSHVYKNYDYKNIVIMSMLNDEYAKLNKN